MKLSLNEVFTALNTLAEEVHAKKDVRIPVSMSLHLRRLERELRNEWDLSAVVRKEFQDKWVKREVIKGENGAPDSEKVTLPTQGDADYDEFKKQEKEIFFEQNSVVAFTPFKLDLLENSSEVVSGNLIDLMIWANEEFQRQQPPAPEASEAPDGKKE